MISDSSHGFLRKLARWLEVYPRDESDPVACSVHETQVRALLDAGQSAVFANLVLAAVTAAVTYPFANPILLFTWLFALVIIVCTRQLFISRTLANKHYKKNSRVLPIYLAGTFLTGLCWAVVPIEFFPREDLSIQTFQALVLIGLAAGASTIQSVMPVVLFSFLAPIFIPLTLRFLTLPEPMHTALAFLTLTFLVFLARAAKVTHDSFCRAVQLRFEKDGLTQKLSAALEEVQKASAMKSSLLANVSHEIKTPMNGIIGMTEEALHHSRSARVIECLENSLEASHWLLQIVNDLLDISQIESGKLNLSTDTFHLKREIARIQKLIAPKILEKSLQLELVVESDVPEFLCGDSLRYGQILLNLLGNAVKFTPEGGQVSIRIALESDSVEHCVIHSSVSDTGIGIDNEFHSEVFQAFAQADTSITRRFGGTGLGLTISSHLCALMNGRIWLESAPGSGSTFHFTTQFKHAEENAAREQIERPQPTTLPPLSILVVDDNRINQKVIGNLLVRAGHAVSYAGNGKEALEQFENDTYDIIFMDCQMPAMDGHTASKTIRKRENEAQVRRTPIVAITAHAEEEERLCLASGMDAFLTKPIDKEKLFRTLHNQYTRWIKTGE